MTRKNEKVMSFHSDDPDLERIDNLMRYGGRCICIFAIIVVLVIAAVAWWVLQG